MLADFLRPSILYFAGRCLSMPLTPEHRSASFCGCGEPARRADVHQSSRRSTSIRFRYFVVRDSAFDSLPGIATFSSPGGIKPDVDFTALYRFRVNNCRNSAHSYDKRPAHFDAVVGAALHGSSDKRCGL